MCHAQATPASRAGTLGKGVPGNHAIRIVAGAGRATVPQTISVLLAFSVDSGCRLAFLPPSSLDSIRGDTPRSRIALRHLVPGRIGSMTEVRKRRGWISRFQRDPDSSVACCSLLSQC